LLEYHKGKMARRKKKKRTRKQQAKGQRQAEIARIRQERGWKPSTPGSKHAQDEVFEDMLPLFPLVDDPAASPADGVEGLMMTLLASDHLIEEPEFDEIIIDPMRCVDVFIEVGQELGIEPEALGQLPEEEREDTQMNMLEMTTQRLLTDELRQDILNALSNLRQRLKRAGKREKAAQAAALQSFLGEGGSSELWPMIGLVRAIVQRSLAAGFELYEASMEVLEAGDLDESDTPLTLSERLAQSSVAQKANTLLQKVPGLSGYLEKQADSIWQEGVDAVFEGDLYLGIFTSEDLEAGLVILQTTREGDIAQEAAAQDPATRAKKEEQGKALVSRIDAYLTELFTPARLDQLRNRLNTILDSSDYERRWVAFIMMLVEYMADEEAVENEKGFLISAFFGEMRAVGAAMEEVTDR
jgi:hypothetical protein